MKKFDDKDLDLRILVESLSSGGMRLSQCFRVTCVNLDISASPIMNCHISLYEKLCVSVLEHARELPHHCKGPFLDEVIQGPFLVFRMLLVT